MGGSWRQGLLNRIDGIGISLACKSFYRETLETSMFVGLSGGIGMMSILIIRNYIIRRIERPKRKNGKRKILYIDGGKNNDVENKTGILYNDTVQQFKKGM
jgi:hypothetical protein